MKGLILILAITLTSCQKNCYKFTITTTTTTWSGSSNPQTTTVVKCDLTSRQAKKVNQGLESTASTGIGKQKVTVETTSSYYIEP